MNTLNLFDADILLLRTSVQSMPEDLSHWCLADSSVPENLGATHEDSSQWRLADSSLAEKMHLYYLFVETMYLEAHEHFEFVWYLALENTGQLLEYLSQRRPAGSSVPETMH